MPLKGTLGRPLPVGVVGGASDAPGSSCLEKKWCSARSPVMPARRASVGEQNVQYVRCARVRMTWDKGPRNEENKEDKVDWEGGYEQMDGGGET